mgnify:CR=1 FL=1
MSRVNKDGDNCADTNCAKHKVQMCPYFRKFACEARNPSSATCALRHNQPARSTGTGNAPAPANNSNSSTDKVASNSNTEGSNKGNTNSNSNNNNNNKSSGAGAGAGTDKNSGAAAEVHRKCVALCDNATKHHIKLYTLIPGEVDALFPTNAARERFERKYRCTIVLDASGVQLRAPEAGTVAADALFAFEKLREDVRRRTLTEVRQFSFDGNVSLLCGAGLEVRDILCYGETATVTVSVECAPGRDEFEDDEAFRTAFLPGGHSELAPSIS